MGRRQDREKHRQTERERANRERENRERENRKMVIIERDGDNREMNE